MLLLRRTGLIKSQMSNLNNKFNLRSITGNSYQKIDPEDYSPIWDRLAIDEDRQIIGHLCFVILFDISPDLSGWNSWFYYLLIFPFFVLVFLCWVSNAPFFATDLIFSHRFTPCNIKRFTITRGKHWLYFIIISL